MYKFGKKSQTVLDTVSNYLHISANRTISKSVIDISIAPWAGLRTAEYQKSLFDKGWSKADGYKKKSNHQVIDSDGKCI